MPSTVAEFGLRCPHGKGDTVNTPGKRPTKDIGRPGQEAPLSGIYNVVTAHGAYVGRQVACGAGQRFPPTRSVGEHGYALYRGGFTADR